MFFSLALRPGRTYLSGHLKTRFFLAPPTFWIGTQNQRRTDEKHAYLLAVTFLVWRSKARRLHAALHLSMLKTEAQKEQRMRGALDSPEDGNKWVLLCFAPAARKRRASGPMRETWVDVR